MKTIASMMIVAVLAGCGADGAPVRPTANLGLSLGPAGITPIASVGGTSGPVTVSVDL
ncbi:MAG: hypothetical protein P8H36_08825 [Yoonia sp.]|nr:hypothetical protein [Yoonia sp.]